MNMEATVGAEGPFTERGPLNHHSHRQILVFLVMLTAVPTAVFAHPVILINYQVEFRFDAHGLQGFTETWEFDAVNSRVILQMFDANNNGKIDGSELPSLQRGYFDDLKDYNFFNSVVTNGQAIPTEKVSDFTAAFTNGRMIYKFFVPLVLSATAKSTEVDVTIWDPTYYTDLSPNAENAVTLEKPSSIEAAVTIANDHRHFYNMAPDIVLVKKPPFYLKMMVVRFKLAG